MRTYKFIILFSLKNIWTRGELKLWVGFARVCTFPSCLKLIAFIIFLVLDGSGSPMVWHIMTKMSRGGVESDHFDCSIWYCYTFKVIIYYFKY